MATRTYTVIEYQDRTMTIDAARFETIKGADGRNDVLFFDENNGVVAFVRSPWGVH